MTMLQFLNEFVLSLVDQLLVLPAHVIFLMPVTIGESTLNSLGVSNFKLLT